MNEIKIGDLVIGPENPPLVIPEIGINHGGDINKAIKMIDDAYEAGAKCVKFQCHIIEDEMIYNDVVPANADISIWEIISSCVLSEENEKALMKYTESKGMLYLSTPFSREAANRLEKMGVQAYKIGSGECNNYPLIEHIARFKKPIILSTGMNNLESIKEAVNILEKYDIDYAILHCTSMYPTPYENVKLGALQDISEKFPNAVIGLSDHSMKNYTCLGAVAMGASILEKHFTSSKEWEGPDIEISIDPNELKDLIEGANAIYKARGGRKEIQDGEKPTIDFAYAKVVSIKSIKEGELFSLNNIWVKRPGTGEIPANEFSGLIGKRAAKDIPINTQLEYTWIDEQ